MKYIYIKSISYSIGERENTASKEEVFQMRKNYQKSNKRKEVSATAR